MNAKEMGRALREYARAVCDDGCNAPSTAKTSEADTAELIRVLARIVEGKSIEASFGAPGDWGYGTPIGEALRVVLD
jgi:hypothetical protein